MTFVNTLHPGSTITRSMFSSPSITFNLSSRNSTRRDQGDAGHFYYPIIVNSTIFVRIQSRAKDDTYGVVVVGRLDDMLCRIHHTSLIARSPPATRHKEMSSPSSATQSILPFPYPSVLKPPTALTTDEKLLKIARSMPCGESQCQCSSWRPKPANVGGRADLCTCGHRLRSHGGNQEDMDRRLRVATRIDQLLEEKGKLMNFEYEDDDIRSLRK
ncbi:hypothetical protein BC938DRAFT_473521 [Jimgerdemannia flammicorona]|uniref:Uncharacterized protein n=1 Tax=Jimgerdemannia flammicorona TaxID=994334 RepID=A0A433QTA2_9FUNG|nr:hypothetical protein BC938DRAFT_473521 [Jimgerdemannia flammicorona]